MSKKEGREEKVSRKRSESVTRLFGQSADRERKRSSARQDTYRSGNARQACRTRSVIKFVAASPRLRTPNTINRRIQRAANLSRTSTSNAIRRPEISREQANRITFTNFPMKIRKNGKLRSHSCHVMKNSISHVNNTTSEGGGWKCATFSFCSTHKAGGSFIAYRRSRGRIEAQGEKANVGGALNAGFISNRDVNNSLQALFLSDLGHFKTQRNITPLGFPPELFQYS